MSWNNVDDKTYRGTIDRQYVSKDEDYEVAYFVQNYLRSRNLHLKANESDIKELRQAVKNCGLRAPILRTDLTEYMNRYCKIRFGS